MRLRRPTTMNENATLVLVCAAALGVAASGCGADSQGKKLFTSVGCSTCHTLADAGATGQVGPNLDVMKPMATQVAAIVAQGGGGMPSFGGQLSSDQVKAVADYVESATHQ
jgi:mono/diheme cytochrome c family protein